jgi:hypothetical protein
VNELNELKALWGKVLGEIPSDQQFEMWYALHTFEVIRRGILKTAQKNLSTGSSMSADHKVRFAAKVMLNATALCKEHAANRARLQSEMEGVPHERRGQDEPAVE